MLQLLFRLPLPLPLQLVLPVLLPLLLHLHLPLPLLPGVKLMLLTTALFTIHSLTLYQGCLLTYLVKETPYEPESRTFDQVAETIRQGKLLGGITPNNNPKITQKIPLK